MRVLTYATFGYAVANFVLFMFAADPHPKSVGAMPPTVVHGFSGHWMAFYAAAVAILYSGAHEDDREYLCPAGHRVNPDARLCELCGLAVSPTRRPVTPT
jgi:hypothetical protein